MATMAGRLEARPRRTAERWFYAGMGGLIVLTVFLGFARSFFLRPWFAGAVPVPPESFFYYVHGSSLTAWIVLLVVQPLLVARRRVDLHRTIGWVGAGLAALVVGAGTIGSVMAAARPGGYIGVPMPPATFLVVPLSAMAMFGTFTGLAIAARRDPQTHKRLMLLGTVAILDAATARWAFMNMNAPVAGLPLTGSDLSVIVFLLPLVAWDLWTRGRLHRATLAGGLAIVAIIALRLPLAETSAWQRFAHWLIGGTLAG